MLAQFYVMSCPWTDVTKVTQTQRFAYLNHRRLNHRRPAGQSGKRAKDASVGAFEWAQQVRGRWRDSAEKTRRVRYCPFSSEESLADDPDIDRSSWMRAATHARQVA